MPLRCVGSDGEELAFVHDEVSWESLRLRNKQHDDLKLPCCNSPVSLKTSKLGTRFFAHKRRDGCTSGPETPEHILAKSIIAAAAMDAGWQVRPEERYLDKDGTCIVDVSCRKPESSRGLAFEIQWSRQKPDVTKARTQRYERHGLRSLWLMRQTDVPVSRSTPAVILQPSGVGFDVVIPDPWGSISNPRRSSIPLAAFVRGVLDGKFSFGLASGGSVPIEVMGMETPCWSCGRAAMVIKEVMLRTDRLPGGYPSIGFGIRNLGDTSEPFRSKILDAVREAMPNVPLGIRHSKTRGDRYLANSCPGCGALFGDFYMHELDDDEIVGRTVADLSREELLENADDRFECWNFDDVEKG